MNLRSVLSRVCIFLVIFLFSVTPISTSYGAGETSGMIQSRIPAGTIASSSGSYSGYPPEKAIDGDLTTRWNGVSNTGTITFNFPYSIALNTLQVATSASPPSKVNYVIYGLQNDKWTSIANVTLDVPIDKVAAMTPISITPGTYNGIKITASAPSTWIAINEIAVGSSVEVPVNLVAAGADSQVNLNWNAVSSADSYIIKYGTEPGKYTETVTATKDDYKSFTINGLTNNTKYYFVVTALSNGVDSNYSNEASAIPVGKTTSTDPNTTPPKDSETSTPNGPGIPTSTGNRALLVITMISGLEKEFDLSISEVNNFIDWYEAKQAGSGKASYAINKHENNKGPFNSRKDYVIFDKILTFEVSEYSSK